ncbi:hypothetical protein [uncultured Ramlibacter sp.]|uniref:hypothetical protein n=1 Tax=uncultured Ramlibacter sp. TaxID=260755 RepID=UPI0026239F59|nr:hypothetical protein [uncultured Ramlibacter sp.]
MRVALCCVALALTAGCSTVSSIGDAWTWQAAGSRPRPTLTAEQVADLISQAVPLQARRNEIRTRISAEPDIWARQSLYSELHAVGMELAPLERQLAMTSAVR